MEAALAYEQKGSVLPLSTIQVALSVGAEVGLSLVAKGKADASITLTFQRPSTGFVEH